MAKASKGGLGRGLSSLIGGYEAPARSEFREEGDREGGVSARSKSPAMPDEAVFSDGVKAMAEVDIDAIVANPDQPRTYFKEEELAELSASIKRDGLLQPLLVREIDGGKYEIIAGERRWQASRLAGLKKLPVRIKQVDDAKVLELALIENLQRSDLNPIEEAYGYRRMMENGGRTQAEVAAAVSKGRSTIANALRLLELPEDAQQLLYREEITAGHARAILSIPSEEGRRKLTEKLRNEKMSVRQAEAFARLLAGKESAERSTKPASSPLFRKTARSLGDAFHTKVRIKTSNGRNRIEIEFKDEDDLQRLFDMMNGSH
ncbi:MAG: ParB/RepB/Spo0J family partition protein [Slackia sp.]|nr:ParB/RepB/Spo0J family partition protein [Slackia sp.]